MLARLAVPVHVGSPPRQSVELVLNRPPKFIQSSAKRIGEASAGRPPKSQLHRGPQLGTRQDLQWRPADDVAPLETLV